MLRLGDTTALQEMQVSLCLQNVHVPQAATGSHDRALRAISAGGEEALRKAVVDDAAFFAFDAALHGSSMSAQRHAGAPARSFVRR